MSVHAVKILEGKCNKSAELRREFAELVEFALKIRQQMAATLEDPPMQTNAKIINLGSQIDTEISTFRKICQSHGVQSDEPFDMDDLCNAAAS